jgi:hypothetical protein
VTDAMPLLVRTRTTEVVTVASEPIKSEDMPGAEVAYHLARHGANVEVKSIMTAETDVANTILWSFAPAGVHSRRCHSRDPGVHDDIFLGIVIEIAVVKWRRIKRIEQLLQLTQADFNRCFLARSFVHGCICHCLLLFDVNFSR